MKIRLRTNEEPLVVRTDEGHLIRLPMMAIGAVTPMEVDPTVPNWIKRLREDELFILNCGDAFRDLEGGLANP